MKIYKELTLKSKKSVFLFFHGMFGNSNGREIQQAKVFLLKKKHSVCVFDYPGHGKSSGKLNEISLKEIYEVSKKILTSLNDFQDIYLVGYSFGANPLLYAASKSKVSAKIKGVILINPATNMLELIFRNKTHDDLDRYTKKHRSASILVKARFFFECLFYNSYNYAKKLKCRFYVYHILNDESVPVSQSKKLEKAVLSKKKFVYPYGSCHSLGEELSNGKYKSEIFPDGFKFIMNSES